MRHLFLYSALKTILPRAAQIRLRQLVARRRRARVSDVWPILESAGRAPDGWQGWPEGKRFAFVLTHDVETQRGLDRCRQIMDIEERLGFRSAFYFVPKRYDVPRDLREEIVRRGFEIGVHGLYHDMTLFRSETDFQQQAREINGYIKDWGATGFRAPYMIQNLEWIRDYLEVAYDTSTFDTDPFEPQPFGVGTIFPFFVERRSGGPGEPRAGMREDGHESQLIELPCTLSQDLTLFVLLGETGINVWTKKADWIATHGGMVLLDTHPDFMQTGPRLASDEYPLQHYEAFLEYVRTRHTGQYWHAMPREVAAFYRTQSSAGGGPGAPRTGMRESGNNIASCPRAERPGHLGCQRISDRNRKSPPVDRVIWIDLDNTPHVPFFRPIIKELRNRGYKVVVTARDAFQVCDLAKRMDVACIQVGRHHGKNRIMKVLGLFYRAAQLYFAIRGQRPTLAVSHGSRSQIILANILGLPSVLIEDYEYARFPLLMRPTWRIVPEVIPEAAVGGDTSHILKYPGIKEDVYVHDFQPEPAILDELGLRGAALLAVVRPPATEAHYHNPESELLLTAVMHKLLATPGIRVVLLPRNRRQGEALTTQWQPFFTNRIIVIPATAIEGLNLLWHADLVVSGGGTMNREAAALGVPVYSIFRGTIGAVDKHLAEQGRLILLTGAAEVNEKLRLCERPRQVLATTGRSETLVRIVAHIERLL